jgi:hypothetical protein
LHPCFAQANYAQLAIPKVFVKMKDIDVTAFINQQPTVLRSVLNALRITIFQTVLHVEESIKCGIPFYSYHGRLCFLNPGDGAVALGLCKGAFLANTQGSLEGVGKEVRHVRIKKMTDIDQVALQTLLQEAMLLNEVKEKRKG